MKRNTKTIILYAVLTIALVAVCLTLLTSKDNAEKVKLGEVIALFERKSGKKKQKTCGFIAHSF